VYIITYDYVITPRGEYLSEDIVIYRIYRPIIMR